MSVSWAPLHCAEETDSTPIAIMQSTARTTQTIAGLPRLQATSLALSLVALFFVPLAFAAPPTPLPNGAELTANGTTIRITALRDDVLRVRIGHPGLPEDASWAVLPEARTATVRVTPTS